MTRTRFLILAPALMVLVGLAAAADPKPVSSARPKLPPGFDVDKMADPKEAAKALEWLEKEYPDTPRPEAVRMLMAILRGSRMDGSDGWFGPGESRYSWEWLAKRHGLESKAAITKDKFAGPTALFERLDRDGDGRIVAADFDWSDRSPFVMQTGVATRLFRRMDAGGDGKVTREELDEFFKQIAGEKEYLTADDLRRAVTGRTPTGGGGGRSQGPTIPVLLKGLFGSEIGSMNEGPKLGDPAPDFTLKTVDGKETVNLRQLIGPKPVVLVLGNFTCGPFRALYPEIETIHQRYKSQATFLMVYVREAHPSDGWAMAVDKTGASVKQPTTLDERTKVCEQFCAKLKPNMPVAVDEISDTAGNLYSGMPGRMYVIDTAGKVAFKSGRGPFGFKAGELEQAVAMALLESTPVK